MIGLIPFLFFFISCGGKNMIIKCNICGKEFKRAKSLVNKTNYCSMGCYLKSRGSVIVKCETCGKETKKQRGEMKRSEHHFCCYDCYAKFLGGSSIVKCDNCAKSVKRVSSVIRRNKHNFCCHACYSKFISLDLTPEEYLKRDREAKKKCWELHKHDINYVIRGRLRSRLLNALQGKVKSARTLELLDLDIYSCRNANPMGTLLQHIEYQFKEGMTWDNWNEWEVDHVIPLSYPEESLQEEFWQRYLCNYKNLQPLWKSDNASKSSKIKFVKNVILDRQTSV